MGNEGDDASVDRLDRVVGSHNQGERVGERLPISEVCGGLPGTTVRVKPWLSEPDVDRTDPAQAALVSGGDVGALAPALIAALPGSKAMVCVGPP